MTDWPQTAAAWAAAIEKGLGLTNAQARAACEGDQFPFDRLEAWVRKAFGEGFHADFVPALLRNQRGLVSWAYGRGFEPFWPGLDRDEPPTELG